MDGTRLIRWRSKPACAILDATSMAHGRAWSGDAANSRGGILTLNAGSSSLKFAWFRRASPVERMLWGVVDRIGLDGGRLRWKGAVPGSSPPDGEGFAGRDHGAALERVLALIRTEADAVKPAAVVHRIVHGGGKYAAPEPVTPAMVTALEGFSPLAPAHLPVAIGLIRAVLAHDPDLFQLACFDTAFHRDLPRVASLLPIPRRYFDAGIRRYGFHGLSYEFLMHEIRRRYGAPTAAGRIVLAHLGNGASMAAVSGGRCIDTTMGFTPAAGLVMGRRSGDLDPGLAGALMRIEGMSPESYDHLIHHESGLLGLSGFSSDVRELLAREASDPPAADALAAFCQAARKAIGSLTAVLGGLDTLVFAGGIGENCPELRRRICAGFDYLGLSLDDGANQLGTERISADGARVQVLVLKTDEEQTMARAAGGMLGW